MKVKIISLLLVATTGVFAQQNQAKWRSQPEVLNSAQHTLTDQRSVVDLAVLREQYTAKKQPVALFLKGRQLTNEITDWSSDRRVKLTQNLRAEGTDTDGKNASLRIDNAVHAEVENKQGRGFSDSGYISSTLQQLIDGANDAFGEIGLKQVSYATVLKKQQMINEAEKKSKREADVTKIEFDAIANQTNWLITTSYVQDGFQFQIIDSKSGVILAQQTVSDDQVQAYKMVAAGDGYKEVAVAADYQAIGYSAAVNVVDMALQAY